MKIADLHCDTIYKFFENADYSFTQNDGHIDEKGLEYSDYLAQCFAVYTPCDLKGEEALSFFEKGVKIFNQKIKNHTKIKAILTAENAEFLDNNIRRIELLKDEGVKLLGLVHNGENCIGFPHSMNEKNHNLPLKEFGKEVVEAINDTNIIIDVSHLNFGGFCDVARLTKKPFLASHSACRSLCDHSRNLTDFQIKIIANSGGLVGIPFYSVFLNGRLKTQIFDILAHLEHLINIGGEDVAAIGTDFDGMECNLPVKSAGEMGILAEAIIKRFGVLIAEKICHKNAMRILS